MMRLSMKETGTAAAKLEEEKEVMEAAWCSIETDALPHPTETGQRQHQLCDGMGCGPLREVGVARSRIEGWWTHPVDCRWKDWLSGEQDPISDMGSIILVLSASPHFAYLLRRILYPNLAKQWRTGRESAHGLTSRILEGETEEDSSD